MVTWETRYVRPEGRDVDRIVELALKDVTRAAGDRKVVESGSSNVVVLAGDVAVRIARDAVAAGELRRVQALIDRLPELPLSVPRTLGPIVEHAGLSAVATRRLSGEPHPPGTGAAGPLRELLSVIHSVDVGPLRPWLAPRKAFCGGERWLEVMNEGVIPLLPPDVWATASERIRLLATLESPTLALNHGDLAGSNVLWREGRVVGVLDWDLCAEEDPAEDVASLAGWHGWSVIEELADPETIARANVFHRSYPLQIIAFHVLHGRSREEIDRAIRRALPALRRT